MWLIRVIIVIACLWIIMAILGWIIKAALIKKIRRMQAQTKAEPTSENKLLVACHQCGTFIDKDQAISHKSHNYCCLEHLEQDQKK